MVKVKRTGAHDKDLEDLLFKTPDLDKEIEKRIIWFKKNPSDTRLKNHPLRRRMKEKWAFNITNDVRIVYEWLGENTVRFLAIGKHNQVYRN